MKKLFYYVEQFNYFFWNRVATSVKVPESSLGIFRWIFGIFLLLFSVPNFNWISTAPDVLFNPPYISLANLFSSFPGHLFFYFINVLIIVSIAFLTVGIKVKWFNYILLISWFVGNNFKYSFGKIDHGIMVLALLICMSFSNWGSYYALIPDKKNSCNSSTKALALFSVLLAFAMFTAGYAKALNWVDFDFSTNGFLSWFYRGYYDTGRTELLASTVLYLPTWLFEFFDYAAVIFELSPFVALLISRRWWLFWLLIACLFHLSNTLLLNISFTYHFAVYLAFVDFSLLKKQIFNQNNQLFSSNIKYCFACFVFCIFFIHFIKTIHGEKFSVFSGLGVYKGVVLWILAAIVIFAELIIKNKIEKAHTKSDR